MNPTQHTPPVAPDYLGILGLQQAPYLESTDARFFYADPTLIQRLDLLQHLTQFGDMLLGISGPSGSGKSALAQQFLLRANTSWRTCRFSGTQLQDTGVVLATLAECFGLQTTGSVERLKAELIRHCQALRHNAQLAVIVIDDAQHLSDQALKSLLELADTPRETLKLLRIVLFSEPGLEQRLIAAGWHSTQQPLLHSLDIPPFDEPQTAAYLMYRLAVAGYSGDSPFSLTEIRAMHKAAGGLPGKLNVLAHETLVERAGRIAARKKAAAPVARRIQPILLVGLLGSLIVGGGLWYLSQEETPLEPVAPLASNPITPPTPHVTPVKPLLAPPVETAHTPEKEPEKSLESAQNNEQVYDTHKENIEPLPAVASPVTEAVSTPPVEPPAPDSPVVAATAPHADSAGTIATLPDTAAAQTTTPPAPGQPVQETKPAEPPQPAPPAVSATPPAEAPSVTPSPSAPVTTPTPGEIPPRAQPAETPVAVQPAVPEAPSTPAQAQPAPTTSPTAAGAGDHLGTEWLQSRPGTHFTLQLLGGRSEKSLREYLRQHRIPEPVATFRTVHKGGDWFVLVHGDFPTITEAQQAINALPPAIRKSKPWPRSFASVHEAIQQQ